VLPFMMRDGAHVALEPGVSHLEFAAAAHRSYAVAGPDSSPQCLSAAWMRAVVDSSQSEAGAAIDGSDL